MSRATMIIIGILEPISLVVILNVGLNQVRERLTTISEGLGTLGGELATVEAAPLRPLAKLVADVNAPLRVITAALPGIAAKAALVVRKLPR